MPWPVEEPVGQNPPDGVSINYYLKAPAAGPVLLEVLRRGWPAGAALFEHGRSDADPRSAECPRSVFWYRQPQKLATTAGLQRFIWDVHYQPLPALPGAGEGGGGRGGLPIQAIPYNSAPAPTTPWVTPGTYTVRLQRRRKVIRATDRRQTGSAGEDAGVGDEERVRS